MSDQIFFEKQFALKGILKGSGKYEDLLRCKKLIQRKLATRRCSELLKIARDYVGYKEGEKCKEAT